MSRSLLMRASVLSVSLIGSYLLYVAAGKYGSDRRHISADKFDRNIAMYIYDCTLTMGQEIRNIWARKWNLSTWVYAANRYSSLLNIIFTITLPTYSIQVCVVLHLLLLFSTYLYLEVNIHRVFSVEIADKSLVAYGKPE